jgi:hypothetical protein
VLEEKANIWEYLGKIPICIPTNGFVKSDGRLVMGRGLAQQARDKFKDLDLIWGKTVARYGNLPIPLISYNRGFELFELISFPVKPVMGQNVLSRFKKNINQGAGDEYPGWMCKADLEIIKKSCRSLLVLMEFYSLDKVVMPRVGCGNGELQWQDVKPVIEEILRDKVIVVDKIGGK